MMNLCGKRNRLFYARKRTLLCAINMSALCQKDLLVLEIKFEFKFCNVEVIGVAR
jgi:hypothetical protein